jgi:putative Mg2+ transporter-C (MgtC) family protein
MPPLLAELPTIHWWDDLARLAVAAGLGGAIGFERELRDREAGFRTHMLVCVGSALFTLVSAYGFREFLTGGGAVIRADPTRIAAQIVTGIGFLGAGAIIRQGLSIRGLTTAATLWVSAAIGIAAGAGYWSGAVFATVLTILALWPLRILGYVVFERIRPEERDLFVELEQRASVGDLLHALEERNARVESIQVSDQADRRLVTLTLDTPSERFVPELSELDFVLGVQWHK